MGYGKGDPRGDQGKHLLLVIMLSYDLVGGKFEVSYAYNGQCRSMCDAICDRTGVVPGIVVLLGRGRWIPFWVREKIGVGNLAFLRDMV